MKVKWIEAGRFRLLREPRERPFCAHRLSPPNSLVFDSSMAPIALPPAATVPPEIVGHILDLALEGDPDAPSELLRRRETLFAFGAVCRAWSAEASRASSVTVTSAQEAVLLRIALERRERERRELDAARG